MTILLLVPHGIALPEQLLTSRPFAVLAAFVAVNTVMYGALALAKVLPKIYVSDWLHPRNRRRDNRSIHPRPEPATRPHLSAAPGLERSDTAA